MSQSKNHPSQPDRQINIVDDLPLSNDEYLSDDSDSFDESTRLKRRPINSDLMASSAKKKGEKSDEKVTVSADYLSGIETMVRDLQSRVDVCEHRPNTSSDSSPSSRRSSITSIIEIDPRPIRHLRHPYPQPMGRRPYDEPQIIVHPDSRVPPPPPPSQPSLPMTPMPVHQGCGPITVDGLPRLETVRWKQYVNQFGDHDWHIDCESPVTANAPKNFSHQSLLTVIREFDRYKQYWRRRLQIVSPSVIGLLKDLPLYDIDQNSRDGFEDGELRLTEPFMVLFHSRKHLQEKAAIDTRRVRDQVQFVLDFMRTEYSDTTQKLDDLESAKPSGLISYPDLFLLYAPGTIVYSRENGEYEAFVVDSLRGMRKRQGGGYGRLDLTCWSINYDGEVFGRVWSIHAIPPFHGTKTISSLDLVPEQFLPDLHQEKSKLISRGEKFWSLHGQKFLEYTGEMWSQQTSDEAVRVMVDHLTYQRRNNWPISIDKKRGPDDASSKNWRDNRFRRGDQWGDGVRRRNRHYRSCSPAIRYNGYSPERSNSRRRHHHESFRRFYSDRPTHDIGSDGGKYDLLKPGSTPDELTLLLCPQHVHGYSLRDKAWKELNVSQLQPVNFRKNAWDRLVLDDEYKDIVQAMVSSYVDKTAMLDDLVAGKGAGLVALLHGPPGSGKTLTAECVADSFEKPLYQVTCGDIGTNAEDLEERLEEIFDYSVTWGAILLLDEADIFLQDRDYKNLKRNALVSIFLRTLEYFNGVLFLTTNRVGTFDQAFQSRIHVTLGLPSLDQQRRISVWTIFLQDLATKGAITDVHYQALIEKVNNNWSKEKLNGRQIRNTVRTALVVAEKKGTMVGEKEFATVLKIGREFENYMGILGKGEVNAGLEGFQEV